MCPASASKEKPICNRSEFGARKGFDREDLAEKLGELILKSILTKLKIQASPFIPGKGRMGKGRGRWGPRQVGMRGIQGEGEISKPLCSW